MVQTRGHLPHRLYRPSRICGPRGAWLLSLRWWRRPASDLAGSLQLPPYLGKRHRELRRYPKREPPGRASWGRVEQGIGRLTQGGTRRCIGGLRRWGHRTITLDQVGLPRARQITSAPFPYPFTGDPETEPDGYQFSINDAADGGTSTELCKMFATMKWHQSTAETGLCPFFVSAYQVMFLQAIQPS